MKIEKYLEVIVDVEISAHEIIAAVKEMDVPDRFREAATVLNQFVAVARGMSLDMFTESQRQIIATALQELADKFKAQEQPLPAPRRWDTAPLPEKKHE